jgi:hypothetical protein
LLRKEHELQIKSLRMQHEEECQRMQEELELQKSKVVIDIFVLLEMFFGAGGEAKNIITVTVESNGRKSTSRSRSEL